MATSYSNVLSQEQLEFLNSMPEVLSAKAKVDSMERGPIYFSISLPYTIKQSLQQTLGIDLSHLDTVPMRWIKGDTVPHIDHGQGSFENTYVTYITDSPGELVVDGESYPITQGSAYVFQEGLSHETINTGSVPRLLLGPMSEQGFPVGAPLFYYSNLNDALNNTYTNYIAIGGSFTIGAGITGDLQGITSWRLASITTGTSSQSNVYQNGNSLNPDGTYYLYPSIPCFLEGTTILCEVDSKETYVPVEQIRKGTLVKTSLDGFKKVEMIGHSTIKNPSTSERIQNRLYKCAKEVYPQLTDDLFITGCHSILVDELTEKQREDTKREVGRIFVTDRKYRLMACVDERAEPWQSEGTYTIWHFALEHTDSGMNYGVYANGGLVVETCSLRFLKEKSNMTLI